MENKFANQKIFSVKKNILFVAAFNVLLTLILLTLYLLKGGDLIRVNGIELFFFAHGFFQIFYIIYLVVKRAKPLESSVVLFLNCVFFFVLVFFLQFFIIIITPPSFFNLIVLLLLVEFEIKFLIISLAVYGIIFAISCLIFFLKKRRGNYD